RVRISCGKTRSELRRFLAPRRGATPPRTVRTSGAALRVVTDITAPAPARLEESDQGARAIAPRAAPGVRCDHCADAIGVYEPVVAVIDGEAREISRASEPTIDSEPAEHYHSCCYLERTGSAAA